MNIGDYEGYESPEPVFNEVKDRTFLRIGHFFGAAGVTSGTIAAFEMISQNENAAMSFGEMGALALIGAVGMIYNSNNSSRESQTPPDDLA